MRATARGWWLAALLGALLPGAAAQARILTEFAPVLVNDARPEVFWLTGEITRRTPEQFEAALERFGAPQLLLLDSNGGGVEPALEVAARVHELGLATAVLKDFRCHSACALVFLAGSPRSAPGELGVHQVRAAGDSLAGGQQVLARMLDALARYGAPPQLIADMLRTPPDGIHVLSREEKAAYGFLDALSPAAGDGAGAGQTSESDALALVERHLALWSQPGAAGLDELAETYAEQVHYYGHLLSRAAVLRRKAEFAARWPQRRYSLLADDLRLSCGPLECSFEGSVEWETQGPSGAAGPAGVMRLALGIELGGAAPRISRETSRVLERR